MFGVGIGLMVMVNTAAVVAGMFRNDDDKVNRRTWGRECTYIYGGGWVVLCVVRLGYVGG